MVTITVMGLVFQILIWAGKSQRFKGYDTIAQIGRGSTSTILYHGTGMGIGVGYCGSVC